MTHHEFWDEARREQEIMLNESIVLEGAKQPDDEPFMNYVVYICDESLNGLPVLEHGFTNSTGMNMILKHILGWNQNVRGTFMRELIAKGSIERLAEKDSVRPYSISVTRNEPI